ncbi:MAG: hypothetical protein ACRDHF_07545 [Tepidiformaceae bacterium]
MPQPAFLVRALGLAGLAVAAGAGAWGVLRVSGWLAPVALGLSLTAALATWGALVQWVGGEKVDDHPWV